MNKKFIWAPKRFTKMATTSTRIHSPPCIDRVFHIREVGSLRKQPLKTHLHYMSRKLVLSTWSSRPKNDESLAQGRKKNRTRRLKVWSELVCILLVTWKYQALLERRVVMLNSVISKLLLVYCMHLEVLSCDTLRTPHMMLILNVRWMF